MGTPQKPTFDPSKVVWGEDPKTGGKKAYTMTDQGLVAVPVVGEGGPTIKPRPDPGVLGGSGNFTPSSQKYDITKPSHGEVYVTHPVTGESISQEEYDRLTGENQTVVGRGLRFFGLR
jgi:hypothetical protein